MAALNPGACDHARGYPFADRCSARAIHGEPAAVVDVPGRIGEGSRDQQAGGLAGATGTDPGANARSDGSVARHPQQGTARHAGDR